MNVKLQLLTVGVLFFCGQNLMAQKTKSDTASTSKEIDEVVVLGYSKVTTKPKDISANTTISSEVLENRPNVSFLNSLQGSAPGVTIASSSGSPGSAKIDVVIRGVSSLNASTDPLIVIDGVPTNANQFRNLNPEDIDAVSILRDAAATSIYGNRGANGVIIVKTKVGKFNSPLTVSYNSTTGVSVLPTNRYNLANAKEFLTIQKNLGVNILGDSQQDMTYEEIDNYKTDTNWTKEFFRPDITLQHNVNATFGGENTSVYSSLGYLSQGGMVPSTDFQRMTFRNNITGKSKNSRFSYNAQVGLAYSKRNQLIQETNSAVNNNVIQNPLQGALLGNPALKANIANTGLELFNILTQNGTITAPNYDRYGTYVLQEILRNKSVFHQIQETTIFAGATLSYKLTDKWSISNRSGVDYKNTNGDTGRDPKGYLARIVAFGTVNANFANPYGGHEQIYAGREMNFNSVTSTNYNFELGENHTFDFGAYLEYTKVHYLYSSQTKNGLDERVWSMGTGKGYVDPQVDLTNPNNPQIRYNSTALASKVDAGSLAYFATLDYDYAGKYGITGLIRRDGTYRFAKDYRWGTFWSAGARWNIDQENFMSDSGFQMLKLRGSYGTQGNQNVLAPNYGSNALLVGANLIRDVLAVGTSYNNNDAGFTIDQLGNPLLQWEEIAQANIGLDFKTLNGKLEGNIDFYNKQTSRLFTGIQVSAINGLTEYDGNLGGIRNRGVELLLRYNMFNKEDFKLSVFANGSYNKNTITDLQIPLLRGSLINEVGGTVYQWNVVPYLGIDPETGKMQYMDASGNTITTNPTEGDRRATGKNYFPAYIGGFGFNAEYKGFFLDTLFSFQADYYRTDNQEYWAYLGQGYAMDGYNVSAHLLNAWTPDNKITDIPSWEVLKANDNSSTSDRFLRDASFLRFKSLMLGYTLPKKFTDRTFIKGMKIFVQGENIYLWRKEYNGFDPEGLGTFPLGSYPNPRTISIGTSIQF
ncbi:TonB-linked SusC/RagA family outer membrane protein [Epilithonimonas xixisoli]|uniref:TonB-linked SusC/RagA family outer membrane protein n=2 Tax=Epilithonimonas xixisoli TaxID=1476462 RepID=A0A4R8IG15_9FLAO|nr:TonB-linked SusC/RagA family outer membrane protein [Epilithonimonas xixisoli]